MNDTKWKELRLAMYGLAAPPRWRTRDLQSGYESDWDREWFHHFRLGGYRTIEWVEIETEGPEQLLAIHAELARIHVPGERTEAGFKVYGYLKPGVVMDYVSLPLKTPSRSGSFARRVGTLLRRLVSDLLAQALDATGRQSSKPKSRFRWIARPMRARVDLGDKDALLDAMSEPR